MVGANLIALTQNNIKRLLAYSGIAHSGYLLMTLVANNATSQSGLLFYLTAYVLSSLGLFAVIVFVSNQSETNVDVENYSGLGVNYPFIAFALTVFLLSLGGFPGTGGFIGKVLILQGSLESGHISLAVALVLSTLISYGYYLRIVWLMWMKDPLAQDADNPSSPIVVPMILQLLLVFTLVSVIYLGLLPGQWIEFVESIAIGK
jgi:NADH-quinone oxidoreductase subunit N